MISWHAALAKVLCQIVCLGTVALSLLCARTASRWWYKGLIEATQGLWSGRGLLANASNRLFMLTVDGRPRTYTIVALNSTAPALFNVSGGTVRLGHGPSASQGTRLWVAHDDSLQPDSYVRFALLGKRLSYRIDLSEVGCSCNAALCIPCCGSSP